jgi:hypothetical protein
MTGWACLLAASVAVNQPEPLPAPRPLVEAVVVPMGPLGPVLPGFVRPSLSAHWQFVSPDQSNWLRPRVVLDPCPHYLVNGKPYYYLPVTNGPVRIK